MEKIKCDNCQHLFMVDAEKQHVAKGLRCPHCLTSVVLGNVKAFTDYVAGSKALSRVTTSIQDRRAQSSKTARNIWSVFGLLLLLTGVTLIILMIVTGYPFFGPSDFKAS